MSEQGADDETAVLARIEGRVQGVWYRGWTVDQADARRLRGWVRNRSDGSVEALFAGPRGAVEAMLAACWQGPPAAKVTKVHTSPAEAPAADAFLPLPTL
jgi:acylphosphatase